MAPVPNGRQLVLMAFTRLRNAKYIWLSVQYSLRGYFLGSPESSSGSAFRWVCSTFSKECDPKTTNREIGRTTSERHRMKKSTVKPHILSWLQSDPAAGVKPFVFTPNLEGKAPSHRSHLITRACLASTTSDFLLVDSSRKRRTRSLVPFRAFLIVFVVCMTWPTRNTTADVGRGSDVRLKDMNTIKNDVKRASRH